MFLLVTSHDLCIFIENLVSQSESGRSGSSGSSHTRRGIIKTELFNNNNKRAEISACIYAWSQMMW